MLPPARPAPVTVPKPPPAVPPPGSGTRGTAPPAEPDAEVSAPEFTEVDLVAGRAGTLPIPVRASSDDRAGQQAAAPDGSAGQPGDAADTTTGQGGTVGDEQVGRPGDATDAPAGHGRQPSLDRRPVRRARR